MTEKSRLFAKLLDVHDTLYGTIDLLGDIPTNDKTREMLIGLLDKLEAAEKKLTTIVENGWWKKDAD